MHEDQTSNRLSRVEALVEGLAKDLSSLASTVERYIGTSGRTNWALVLAGVAALGSFIWLYVGPVETATRVSQAEIMNLREQYKDHDRQLAILETDIKWMKKLSDPPIGE